MIDYIYIPYTLHSSILGLSFQANREYNKV